MCFANIDIKHEGLLSSNVQIVTIQGPMLNALQKPTIKGYV